MDDAKPTPSEIAAKSNETGHWTKADFLHNAQELKRRLAVWHIEGKEPVYCPRDPKSLIKALNAVFRDQVMQNEHLPNQAFVAYNVVEGHFVRRPKDPYSKYITLWEFRDFCEHLKTAGDSDEAKLIRLKVERLLDCPMHLRARNEVFGDFITGRPIEQSLMDDLLEAVKVYSQTIVPVIVPADPVVADPQYSLDRTNRTLEWFGERFETIERNPFQVIEVLYEAFLKGSQWVTLDRLRSSCLDVRALDRGMAEVFNVRVEQGRGRKRKRVNAKHPIYKFIEKRGGAGAASYRLKPTDENRV